MGRVKLAPALMSLIFFLSPYCSQTEERTIATAHPQPISSTFQFFLPYVGQNAQQFRSMAGLVFKNNQGLWLVDPSGSDIFLIDQPEGQVSPDGTQAAYWYWDGQGADDIWLANLLTGERINLTNSVERIDRFPEWWPAMPGLLVFGSERKENYPGGPSTGFPAIIDSDGSGFEVLDEEEGGLRALSPLGNRLAYGGFDNLGRIYHWGIGPENFDPIDYGVSIAKLYQPAWSPDEKHLAWSVLIDLNGNLGLVVFDLIARTAQIRHAYTVTGGPAELHFLSWSPDGGWLAIVTWSEAGLEGQMDGIESLQGPSEGPIPNLWAIDPFSALDEPLGQGFHPIWSPDGKWLAYTKGEPGFSQGVWIAQANTWDQIQALPQGNEAVGWIQLSN